MIMDKKMLRKQVKDEIDTLPDAYIKESDEGIFQQIINLEAFKKAQVIFAYYSVEREPDTINIIQYALREGKTVTLPVCFKGGLMEARAIGDLDELESSAYGLLEPLSSKQIVLPEKLDFIIVPGLTFDLDGYRLGKGGGYYDRYLCKTTAFTAGITRCRLLKDTLPKEAHDIPVDCIVTEKKRETPRRSLANSG